MIRSVRTAALLTAALAALAGCTNSGGTERPPTPRPSTTTAEPVPADGALVVTEQSFTVLRHTETSGYEVSYGAVLRNSATHDATAFGSITVSWFDTNGTLLRMANTSDDLPATVHADAPRLRPGQQTAVAGRFWVSGDPAEMRVAVDQVHWRPAAEVPAGTVTAANVTLARADEQSVVTVTVVSEFLDPVVVTTPVLFRSAAGALLGGGGIPQATRDVPPGTTVHTIDLDTDAIPAGTVSAQVVPAARSSS